MNNSINDVIIKYNTMHNNQFNNSLSVTSDFLDIYAKALGVAIKRDRKFKLTNFYYNRQRIGGLKGLRVSTTSKGSFDLCRDKFKLEKYLEQQEFKSLNSKLFKADEYEKAKNYIEDNSEYSYVLKPLSLAGGKGIELDVRSENFEEAWNDSILAQKKNKVKNPSCIVQRFINGFDIRVSVIEGRFSAATLRLPSHIVGNGNDTIEDLINEKNRLRSLIKYFNNKLIPIDNKLIKRLQSEDKSLDSIPSKDEVLLLTDISNLTLGGESIDITDTISEEIITMAINAIASIPGLHSGGVDMMTEDYKGQEAFIIEINTNANHTMHHIPLKGEPREPFKDLLESLLVKHKVENKIQLNDTEKGILSEILNFYNKKDYYANKLISSYSI